MADRTPLTSSEIEQLVAQYPHLPLDYLNYMRNVGWGESPSGHMIYSGPIAPCEVYPQLDDDHQSVLIGDDMQGYCLAYNFSFKRYGEFSDFGVWSSFSEGFDLPSHLAGGSS